MSSKIKLTEKQIESTDSFKRYLSYQGHDGSMLSEYVHKIDVGKLHASLYVTRDFYECVSEGLFVTLCKEFASWVNNYTSALNVHVYRYY